MEKTPGGYNGKILRVSLSEMRVSSETIDEKFCRKYLGGSGFVAYFLLKELRQGIDPLGPENKLVFAVGPMTGTTMFGSSRTSIGAKSPLSGGIALSQVGEYWGAELKRAGYDAIIVEGKAEKPVYLWVHDDEASLRDAGHLWGKFTKDAQQAIRTELGDDKIRVAIIGPGGEKMVRFACIMNGLFDAAGRGGLGAVMGSKNLKAIAVRGHKVPRVADPARVKELKAWFMDNMYGRAIVKSWHEYGTGGPEMELYEVVGNLPVRNRRDGLFPEVKKIHGGVIKETIRVGMDTCYACPVRCKKVVKVDEPYPVDPAYGGPEYETLAALGSNCGIDDLKAICKGNELGNASSLDTISTGGVIGFAMECFERGLLGLKDTGGLDLRFGNAEAMLKCVELIARREGIGGLMAEGTARLAERIGRGAEEFALHVKGIDAAFHEPRFKRSMGIAYMVNPHGADHVASIHDDHYVQDVGIAPIKSLGFIEPLPIDYVGPRKIALFKFGQLKQILTDCLVMCHLATLSFRQEAFADFTAAVTGWNTGMIEQLKVAERVLTMARLFNLREGLTAADDKLPLRFFQPKTDGPQSDKGLDPEQMAKARSYYYTLMGWDVHTGGPTPEKLEELEITWP